MGKVLDSAQVSKRSPLTVYEATEQAPAWTVKMRHVMVFPSPTGLAVMEVLALNNPTDRAWLGPPDGQGNRTSIVLDLPADANGFRFDGAMDESSTAVSAGRAACAAPLKPGMSQIRMGYVVPITGGQAKFNIVAPAPVENLMLFVPNDGQVISQAPGLAAAGTHEVHGKAMRLLRASGLAVGARTSVVIGGLAQAARPTPPASRPGAAPAPSRWSAPGRCCCVWPWLLRLGGDASPTPAGRRTARRDRHASAIEYGLGRRAGRRPIGRGCLRPVPAPGRPGDPPRRSPGCAGGGGGGAAGGQRSRQEHAAEGPGHADLAQSGPAALFGQDVAAGTVAIRSRIGLISHQPMLYRDLTVGENLEFFGKLYGVPGPRRRAAELLDLVGLAGTATTRSKPSAGAWFSGRPSPVP